MECLLDKIQSVIGANPSNWVVCFIPASTKSKHLRRDSSLSGYLSNNLSCPVYIDGIDVSYDRESGHMTGKTGNPIENMEFNPNRFAGKKVVLVDDVRTRGVTFNRAADKLVTLGAVSVFGVFLAQTIHPNLPVDPHPRAFSWEHDPYSEIMDEVIEEQYMQEELYQELCGSEISGMEDELMEDIIAEETSEIEFLDSIGLDYRDFM